MHVLPTFSSTNYYRLQARRMSIAVKTLVISAGILWFVQAGSCWSPIIILDNHLLGVFPSRHVYVVSTGNHNKPFVIAAAVICFNELFRR